MFPAKGNDFRHFGNVFFSVVYGTVALIGGLAVVTAVVFAKYVNRSPNP